MLDALKVKLTQQVNTPRKKLLKNLRFAACFFALCLTHTVWASSEAENLLSKQYPALAALYAKYPQFHSQLSDFAIGQGFTDPIENLATVTHELIHIDSAAHQGYLIGGTYYAPYLAATAWPPMNNKEVEANMTDADRSVLGPLYFNYLSSTPNNTLGNVLDEINAYTQTIPFICANSPQSASKHLNILVGHVTFVDFYLGLLLSRYPVQYRALSDDKTSRGALETIIANAYTTLNFCYRLGVQEANPRPIPKDHTRKFAAK